MSRTCISVDLTNDEVSDGTRSNADERSSSEDHDNQDSRVPLSGDPLVQEVIQAAMLEKPKLHKAYKATQRVPLMAGEAMLRLVRHAYLPSI